MAATVPHAAALAMVPAPCSNGVLTGSNASNASNRSSASESESAVSFCRPEAYELFCAQQNTLNTNEGLLRSAIAISLHALDDIDPRRIEQRLEVLALRVRERSPSHSERAILANLHQVLFEEEGFAGELDRYYNALNSYLPAVLNTRRGIPITLSLLYKIVGEWAGLTIQGINAPGHFMVRVRCDNAWMIVDPFFGGQMLTWDEAFARLDRIARGRISRSPNMLATPTHREWLVRWIGNLQQIFATEGRLDDLAAMNELAEVLSGAVQPVARG